MKDTVGYLKLNIKLHGRTIPDSLDTLNWRNHAESQ